MFAVLEEGAKGATSNELHFDHEAGLGLVELVELHDVGVVEGREDLGLLGE